nr:uncharacterized protein LOC109163772 [Ipomoea batatas]
MSYLLLSCTSYKLTDLKHLSLSDNFCLNFFYCTHARITGNKGSSNQNNPRNTPVQTSEQHINYSGNNHKSDRQRKALAVEEKSEEKIDKPCTSSSSSESESSEDEKGFTCLFSQEESDEELCLMAEEEEFLQYAVFFVYSSIKSRLRQRLRQIVFFDDELVSSLEWRRAFSDDHHSTTMSVASSASNPSIYKIGWYAYESFDL